MKEKVTTYFKNLDTPTKILWGLTAVNTVVIVAGFVARKPSATVTAEMIRTLRHFIPV